jgi:hypothetical protein
VGGGEEERWKVHPAGDFVLQVLPQRGEKAKQVQFVKSGSQADPVNMIRIT